QGNAGAFSVLRFSPEGDVPIAPNLSVTFSQPMVAVTSQEEAAENVPVRLSPQPPGKWHWIGTRTLLFEPDKRFPMATRYSVSVPAGTKSANGGSLASPKTWNFTTPAPSVKRFLPDLQITQRRDVLMFAEFDQRIDPAQVLRFVKLQSGSASIAIRLATAEEIQKDQTIQRLTQKAESNRWLVFRAVDASGRTGDALPPGSKIEVSFLPGLPSAEGPAVTTKPQAFPFSTFGPLRITESSCGYDKRCRPNDGWRIAFSNPLDLSLFDESKITIEPALKGMKPRVYSNQIYFSGTAKA